MEKKKKTEWWRKLIKKSKTTTITGEDLDLLGQNKGKGYIIPKDCEESVLEKRRDMDDLL